MLQESARRMYLSALCRLERHIYSTISTSPTACLAHAHRRAGALFDGLDESFEPLRGACPTDACTHARTLGHHPERLGAAGVGAEDVLLDDVPRLTDAYIALCRRRRQRA